MHTFDQFELVDELQATALGATSFARLMEGGGQFVVKAFCPSPDLMSEAEVGRRAAAFLDRVRIQQAVVQSGAAHWAEIHDAGPIDGGAFYAVARYPFSARKLIVGRARISASDLAQIVGGIAEGLSELKRACGRAHGNLKPSNILLEKPGGPGTTRVRLTDPADAQYAVGAGAESEDLYALGRLLFELVTLRPCSGAAAWPVVDSDLWSRLGPTAQRWRELCSWLVHPCPEEGSRTLDQLHRQLLTLAPRRRRSPSARVLAGVAAVMVLPNICPAPWHDRAAPPIQAAPIVAIAPRHASPATQAVSQKPPLVANAAPRAVVAASKIPVEDAEAPTPAARQAAGAYIAELLSKAAANARAMQTLLRDRNNESAPKQTENSAPPAPPPKQATVEVTKPAPRPPAPPIPPAEAAIQPERHVAVAAKMEFVPPTATRIPSPQPTTLPAVPPVRTWSERVELISTDLRKQISPAGSFPNDSAENMIRILHQLHSGDEKDNRLLVNCEKCVAEGTAAAWQAKVLNAFEDWGDHELWARESLSAVKLWAEAGVARAMAELGKRYHDGDGVGFPRNYSKAIYWYQKAGAEPHAQTNLAAMYESGEGIAHPDYGAAINLYSQAAAAHFSVAMMRLGNLFSKGRGVEPDDARAAYWFGEAAKLGDPVAMRNLAGFYEVGRGGLARDLGQALTWRRNAASAGDEESKRWLRAHSH